jgi:hypothetical protein
VEVTSFDGNITSEHPDRLAAFYRDIVGLTTIPDMGENALIAGGPS